MRITLQDDREYAWLLVRSDTLVGELLTLWRLVPVRPGSWLSAAVVYPIRVVLLVLGGLCVVGLTLGIFAVVVEIPVLVFAYVHPLLPPVVWRVVLWAGGALLLGGLAIAVGVWLTRASRPGEEDQAAMPAYVADVLPPPPSANTGWNRWRSVHVGHDSSRAVLFAGNFVGLGILTQCLAVLAGAGAFTGPVETAWRWPLFFAEQLFQTMLLGIPAGLMPSLAAIAPGTTSGHLLLALVNVFHASGVIAMMVMVMASTFKPRELFKGTVRDLADHIENTDTSGGDKLTIHRVGVVRPLDPEETVSLSKAEFIAIVSAPPGEGA